MPLELGSFNVIIGMDWLANNHAMIVCDEKIVCIPFGDEILIVQGDESDKGKKSMLSVISYTKTQKYMEKDSGSSSDSFSDYDIGSYDYMSKNSSEYLMTFMDDRDLDLQFPKQTKERSPKPESTSTSRDPYKKKYSCGEVPEFMQEGEEKKNKRYKLSGSILLNTRESEERSINLNTTVGGKEDEVHEFRRSRPSGIDQAKRKAKAGSSSAGSANSFDVESLAKMMANGYVMASDLYNVQKSQEMSELLRIKKQDWNLRLRSWKFDV
ncbi:hypothetical protein Tco_0766033 [Tanacetum coccineum]